MSHLPLILAHPPETPLSDVLHMLDRYTLEMELADAGHRIPWLTILAWETCGDVATAVEKQAA